MFMLTRPSEDEIKEFLRSRKADSFSYHEVGATRDSTPAGYNIDHNRALIGDGLDDFLRAKQAVREWKMFDVPGLKLFFTDTSERSRPRRSAAGLPSRILFSQLLPDRLRDRRTGQLRICLRNPDRARRDRRGKIRRRVRSGFRRSLVRHLRVLTARASSREARLPVQPVQAKTICDRIESGDAEGGKSVSGIQRGTGKRITLALPLLQLVNCLRLHGLPSAWHQLHRART
ncbi:hypothetical protein BH18ACI3_BH18ACI3_11510 [soil metagenome]